MFRKNHKKMKHASDSTANNVNFVNNYIYLFFLLVRHLFHIKLHLNHLKVNAQPQIDMNCLIKKNAVNSDCLESNDLFFLAGLSEMKLCYPE